MIRTFFSSLAVILLVQIGISKTPYLEGHYFDRNNEKITGLIKYQHRESFKFKTTHDEKAIKIDPSESFGFVINEGGVYRKFETIFNFPMQVGHFNRKKEAGFAEVLQEGDLIFYKHRVYDLLFDLNRPRVTGDQVYIDNYLIRKGRKGVIHKIPQRNNKKLADVMLPLIKDDTVLKRKFESNEISFEVIEKIVELYNKKLSS